MSLPCVNEPNTLEECVGRRWMEGVTPMVLFGITGVSNIVLVAHDYDDADMGADKVAVWVKMNEDGTINKVTVK